MSMVNTCVNEVNHRLIVSRLPGRLGRISCGHCSWLVWKAGVCSVHRVKSWLGNGQWEERRKAACSWPLGRGSGVERTVPFSTALENVQAGHILQKGLYAFPQEPPE